jgi:hypothetical protein
LRVEVTGGRRKQRNEELSELYSSPSIIRIIKSKRKRWAGNVARMGEKIKACRLLVGKPEGKRPLGRSRRRWVDNIKMDLLEIGWGGVDCIGVAQDRDKWRALVNAVMNLRVMLGNYQVATQFVDSRVVLSSVELVNTLLINQNDPCWSVTLE